MLESAGWLRTTTTAGTGQVYYSRTPLGTIAEGLIFRCAFEMISGGTVASTDAGIVLRLADSTDEYKVSISFSTTQFRVYDVGAAATVATVTVDTTAGVEILGAMSDGN